MKIYLVSHPAHAEELGKCIYICVYEFVENIVKIWILHVFKCLTSQLIGGVEYKNCISAVSKTYNKCPVYDIKPSDGEVLALELWGICDALLLQLLLSPLWPRVVASDRFLSVGQIQLFDI